MSCGGLGLLLLARIASAADGEAPPAPQADSEETPARTPVSRMFTSDTDLRYWVRDQRHPAAPDRPIYNYVEQVERFTAQASTERMSAFVQVDQVSLWANRYRLDGELLRERELRSGELPWPLPLDTPAGAPDTYANVEKVQFTRKLPSGDLTVGDFYAAFGRGLALNVNRNVDIDIDTSIQGLKLALREGDWDLTVLAGQLNRQQVWQENPNIGLRPDFRHSVAGVSAVRYGLGPANLGAHAVAWRFTRDPRLAGGFTDLGAPDAVIAGLNSEVSALGIDWAAEIDALGYPTTRTLGQDPERLGIAGYGSATAYLGATTWQLEGKHYDNAHRPNALLAPELYQVVVGPTLEYERQITEDSSAAVNSNDISGGRLRVDWSAVPGSVTPYASVAVFRDRETAGGLHFNTVPETVVHVLAGTESRYDRGSIVLNVGYRRDERDGSGARVGGADGACGEADADRQVHGDVDIKFPLPFAMKADFTSAVEWFCWGANPLQQHDYVETENSLTVEFLPGWFAVGYMDFTTNPLVDSTGNLGERLYGAGELQWKPTGNLTIKAFAGAYKAGIRCAGGQCRILPGFEGARASVTANF